MTTPDPKTDLTKAQFQKLMKRPSLSELDAEVARVSRRNDMALQRETTQVDKLVKVCRKKVALSFK